MDGDIHRAVVTQDSPVSVRAGYVVEIIVPNDQVFIQGPHVNGTGIHENPHRFLPETVGLVDFVPFHDSGRVEPVGFEIMGSQTDGTVGEVLEHIVGNEESISLAMDGGSRGHHLSVVPEKVRRHFRVPATEVGENTPQVTLLESVVPDT